MKWGLLVAACGVFLQGQEVPGWWKAVLDLPRLECGFRQESESAVFGKLQKTGQLQLTRGGKIRVAYVGGLLIVADGKSLVQYDPGTRTAQKLVLKTAAADMPLLNILLDPKALDTVYRARVQPNGSLLLEPRKPGLPKVELEGKGALLRKISWMDATGARQVLELLDARVPNSIPESVYKLRVPEGTRWLEVR